MNGMKKVDHDPDHQDAQDRHHQNDRDHAQNQDHDQRRDQDPVHDQNAKTHVIEVGHVTRKSLEASLSVKAAVEADLELQRRSHEDRDHDRDPKFFPLIGPNPLMRGRLALGLLYAWVSAI